MQAAMPKVVFAARWFLARNDLRARRHEPPKPDPHSELVRLSAAVDELSAAIASLSAAARQHLTSRPSPGAGDPRWTPLDLSYAINRFAHDNRRALRALPARSVMGRPDKPHEEFLIYRFREAWAGAFGGAAPSRGWRAFRAACADPLSKFGQAGLPARSDRAWETLLAAGQRRAMSEGKSAD